MTDETHARVLIAGVSTRALAVSAARAGYRVTAVDRFGDLDLRAIADVITVRPERRPGRSSLLRAAISSMAPAGLVAYTSSFENYPRAVARLSQGRSLLGNPPEVLTRIRNPVELSRLLQRQGIAAPETRATAPSTPSSREFWLLKPRRSGGGHGIRPWSPGEAVPRSSYLQKRISGVVGSIAFAANGRTAVILGFSRQLVGEARFGAYGFRYCGSILGTPTTPLFAGQTALLERATTAVDSLTREFGLKGLNGLDFVARSGVPYPIEVNPRYSASMELIERGQQVSMFRVHADASRGILPAPPPSARLVQGKAILFARYDVVLEDTRRWLEQEWLADIPHPGEPIQRGHPICTVFAEAPDEKSCLRLLSRRARAVYRFAQANRRRVA